MLQAAPLQHYLGLKYPPLIIRCDKLCTDSKCAHDGCTYNKACLCYMLYTFLLTCDVMWKVLPRLPAG